MHDRYRRAELAADALLLIVAGAGIYVAYEAFLVGLIANALAALGASVGCAALALLRHLR